MTMIAVVGGLQMRLKISRWLAIAGALLIGGCADLLPYPPIGSPLGVHSYTRNVYARDVIRRIECELDEFLDHADTNLAKEKRKYPIILNRRKRAQIKLTLQTELGGGVSYVGIDLNKLGLTSLGQLVAINTNKIPSLQAGGRMKGVVTTDLVMSIPQRISAGRGTTKDACASNFGNDLFKRLYLKDWLANFYEERRDEGQSAPCISKVTLKTSFQVGVDVSTGVNPIAAPLVLIPINGINGSLSPSLSHTLSITFNLKNKHKEKVCKNPNSPEDED